MNRKGITPVIATSLLILIAIASVTTAAVFLRDTTSDLTGSVNDKLSEDKKEANSQISIEYGYNNSDGEISVVVRNTGRYTLAVEENDKKKWDMYSDGRPQAFDYTSYSNPSQVLLDSGEAITLDTNVGYPTSSYKRLEITGPFGVEASILCVNEGGNQNC